MNKINKTILLASMTLIPALAFGGDADALMALDKAWGEAKVPEDARALISDKLLAIDAKGMSGKAELMKTMAMDGPPAGPYEAGDYKVEFLSADTAVMVHSAGSGKEAHWSMHVWQKMGGKWQVAATASVPAGM